MSSGSNITATATDNGYGYGGGKQEQEQEYERNDDSDVTSAAAYLSSTGPCQGFGDLYLTCVATAGLGMCRSLRGQFEQCAKAQHDASVKLLHELGSQLCPHITTENNGGNGSDIENRRLDRERLLCAANLMNQQLMHGYSSAVASNMTSSPPGSTSTTP
jgi:hypothetical protein